MRGERMLDPAGLLTAYGNNLGNMLFPVGTAYALANAKLSGGYNPSHDDLVDRDVVVITAANWLNSYSDFAWLASLLETKLAKFPVVVVGLGAQSDTTNSIPTLLAGTRRLVSILAERSIAISTRGAFTSEVLAAYGVHNSVVTGCPSLLLAGAALPTFREVESPTWPLTAVHSTRHLYNRPSSDLQTYFYRQAMKHSADLFLQSELAELHYALNSPAQGEVVQKSEAVLQQVYGEGGEVADYLTRHAKAYLDVDSWLDALRSKQFCLGTRLHGTIAALLAGTPAVLVTHDARTSEIALPMRLPVLDSREIDVNQDFNLNRAWEAWSASDFLCGYETYKRNFLGFFGVNRVLVNYAHFGIDEADGARSNL